MSVKNQTTFTAATSAIGAVVALHVLRDMTTLGDMVTFMLALFLGILFGKLASTLTQSKVENDG